MKTIILKTRTHTSFTEARALLGDLRVDYTVGAEAIPYSEDDSFTIHYVVFSVSYLRWIFLKRRLYKELENGAYWDMIETF